MSFRLHRATAAALVVLVGSSAATFAAAALGSTRTPRTPTRAQIRAAIRRAKHSRDLWATVNICNTTQYPNTIGIRGQMPALGFPATLKMVFGVDYWSDAKQAFIPLAGVTEPVRVGRVRRGVHQEGASFAFTPHAGVLRGRVSFQWRFRGRLIGHVTRVTRDGHPSADYGDPSGFSSWKCVIA